jgi:histidine ammonia-lyase
LTLIRPIQGKLVQRIEISRTNDVSDDMGEALPRLSRPFGYVPMTALAALLVLFTAGPTRATPYRAIQPPTASVADPITLTGHDLTVEQVIAVARNGQAVEISPEAARHQEDAHGLLLEGAAEGMPIAGFNRAENSDAVLFDGDPASPDVAAGLVQRALAAFQAGATPANGPEVLDEDAVRAMMVVRANTLTYAPASAPVTQILLGFLNNRITPVVATGAVNPLAGVAAAMVGKGDAYYHGIRMTAAQALAQAGLVPFVPVDADYAALTGTDAYDIGRAALLVGDGRLALEWADLIFAMDLNGMNAGIGPLSLPAQANRPFKWIYWDAGRVLDMIKGSYLLSEETVGTRTYPDRLAASPTRQGAAWQAWSELGDDLLIALNSSDQSPAVRVGLSLRESPELGTPEMMKYFVKGGKNSGGKRGFIVPALNRDPYPMENDLVAFTNAFHQVNSAIGQRVPTLFDLASPARDGMAALNHAEDAVGATFLLLGQDLTNAAKLLDRRIAENAARIFGAAPTAAWTAFRATVPAQMQDDGARAAAAKFIHANQPASFYPKGEPPLGTDDPIPLAQEKIRR